MKDGREESRKRRCRNDGEYLTGTFVVVAALRAWFGRVREYVVALLLLCVGLFFFYLWCLELWTDAGDTDVRAIRESFGW